MQELRLVDSVRDAGKRYSKSSQETISFVT